MWDWAIGAISLTCAAGSSEKLATGRDADVVSAGSRRVCGYMEMKGVLDVQNANMTGEDHSKAAVEWRLHG